MKEPSSITSKQIGKRLQRIVNSGICLLILDTSNPDFMGGNLAKWLREIKNLRKNVNQDFRIIIDASNEFPAQLPADLRSDCWTIRWYQSNFARTDKKRVLVKTYI